MVRAMSAGTKKAAMRSITSCGRAILRKNLQSLARSCFEEVRKQEYEPALEKALKM